jgi:hypothetical protein
MQDCVAFPLVRGEIVIQLTVEFAVQLPDPEVRIDPPPPSLAKDRVGGSMLIWANAASELAMRITKLVRVFIWVGVGVLR